MRIIVSEYSQAFCATMYILKHDNDEATAGPRGPSLDLILTKGFADNQ